MTVIDDVHALTEPVCTSAGLELVDIELESGVLRITVDQEGGLPVGALTSVTRQIALLLDEDDPIPGRYTLEVSSPGLERKLRTPAHFLRAVGETVTLRTSTRAEGGPRRFQGTLTAADDDGITVVPDQPRADDPETGVILRYDQIDKARTVFVWDAESKGSKHEKTPSRKKASKQ
ncbi:MAG TPA: ribosome maturation factor RimP [Iamia sp.]|nr:ribosome maturation factor RimP [Iamia sp.]